uniref:diacylglycerol O-acyltransferase n=1 Tax=Globodera pallida TaxID=36090 RepID=A0A183C0G7_GLOPA
MISCDRESIEYVLSRPEKGNAVALVVGGSREVYEAHPTKHRLVLATRKGFVRLAIKHGASLVPIYLFGETNTCDYSVIQRIKKFENLFFPTGQGLLASLLPKEWFEKLPGWFRVGLLPHRRRIVTVVGVPIEIEQNPEPSEEYVSQVHAEYCSKLLELFNTHKTTVGGLEDDVELEFI